MVKSYVPPFELDKPLEGGAVGEVIESRCAEFKPDDAVTSNFGWREYFNTMPKDLHRVSREFQPLSVYLGALGMTGSEGPILDDSGEGGETPHCRCIATYPMLLA